MCGWRQVAQNKPVRRPHRRDLRSLTSAAGVGGRSIAAANAAPTTSLAAATVSAARCAYRVLVMMARTIMALPPMLQAPMASANIARIVGEKDESTLAFSDFGALPFSSVAAMVIGEPVKTPISKGFFGHLRKRGKLLEQFGRPNAVPQQERGGFFAWISTTFSFIYSLVIGFFLR